jgi:hypothetical protein
MSYVDDVEHYQQVTHLTAYMHDKIDMRDWHAVSDAANDLRVLDAERDGRIKAEEAAKTSHVARGL